MVSGSARWVALSSGLIGVAIGAGTVKITGATSAPDVEEAGRVSARVFDRAQAVEIPRAPPREGARCPAEPPLPPRAPVSAPPAELARLIREEPQRLGSASIGSPTRGSLWNAVSLVASEGITPAGDHPWGTESVVRSIERAVREVRRCYPGAPTVYVGDISRKEGGWLRPHKSHQSGLDADIGYFYRSGPAWFKHADAENLDRARTWGLVRALVDGKNVDSIFMDRGVQALLLEHLEASGEERARFEGVFETNPKKRDGIIHHAPGHATHFHVRFRDPESLALGVRVAPMMKIAPPPPARASMPRARPVKPAKPVKKQAPAPARRRPGRGH